MIAWRLLNVMWCDFLEGRKHGHNKASYLSESEDNLMEIKHWQFVVIKFGWMYVSAAITLFSNMNMIPQTNKLILCNYSAVDLVINLIALLYHKVNESI